MRAGTDKYRKVQHELDEVGITTFIKHIGKKWYEVYVNFEIAKAYKTRASCNNYLLKLKKQHCNATQTISA